MSVTTPSCCEHQGLIYPDGGQRCHRHASPEDRALVSRLDGRAKRARILGKDGWPYGPNIDVQSRQELLDWAEPFGLRQADTRCQGLHWLDVGRCGVAVCRQLGSWMRHVTRWTWSGEPAVLIAQPYQVRADELEAITALGAGGRRNVWIDGTGWYGNGTTFIQVWRSDVLEAAQAYA